MQRKIRAEIQLILVLVLATISMGALSLVLSRAVPSLAQGPATPTPPKLILTKEDLAAFGILPDSLEAAATRSFDLEVVKSTDVVSVPAGTVVNFTVTITNHGGDEAIGVVFQDFPPLQMVDVQYAFEPGTTVISNGATTASDLKWYFYDPIPVGGAAVVTVTGELTSLLSLTVTNTAMITTVNPGFESGPYPNSDSVGVGVGGNPNAAGRIIYLPYISKFPTPTPLPIVLAYYEDFNSDTPWFEDLGSHCKADHTNSLYQVDVDGDNRECLPPAKNENNPEKPYRTYGEFEVVGYISGDWTDNGHAYGIWLNGAGGDTQYIFRIYPNIGGCSNGGKWEFLRRKPDANATLASENCDSHIKRGYGYDKRQTIRVGHKNTGEIKLYIDGTLIRSIVDNNQITDGTATGVYIRANDGKVRVKFDDFKVYKYQ